MIHTSETIAPARKNPGGQKEKPQRVSRGQPIPRPQPRRETASPQLRKPRPASGTQPETNGTGFTFHVNPTLTLVCLPNNAPPRFSLEATASLTGVHPALLRYYCRSGLVDSLDGQSEAELYFGESALQEIRRIQHYRRDLAVSCRALPLICELRREADRQHIEIQFLQYP